MVKSIVSRSFDDYQLISSAIELVHKIFNIVECKPELLNDSHVARANELATKWNQRFIEIISTSKDGE